MSRYAGAAGGRDRGKNCRKSPARDAGTSGLAGTVVMST